MWGLNGSSIEKREKLSDSLAQSSQQFNRAVCDTVTQLLFWWGEKANKNASILIWRFIKFDYSTGATHKTLQGAMNVILTVKSPADCVSSTDIRVCSSCSWLVLSASWLLLLPWALVTLVCHTCQIVNVHWWRLQLQQKLSCVVLCCFFLLYYF